MDKPSKSPPQTGVITFVEAYTPRLQAGEYLVSVELKVDGTDSKGAIAERYVHARRLLVQGERYAIDPADINSVFPADLNRGDHDNVLPHIVFARKTLPWERDTGLGRLLDTPPTRRVPWLALLVFSEHDGEIRAQNVKVGELAHDPYPPREGAAAVPSSLPASTASYADGYAATYKGALKWELERDQKFWDICRVIDVPTALFQSIAPSRTDLGWLAHARTITNSSGVADTAQSDPAGEQRQTGGSGNGDFALIFANRFPDANSTATVHLVSLEGMAGFLPAGDDGAPVPIKTLQGKDAEHVRLVSLHSWSFTCIEPRESFTGYFSHLDVGALRRRTQAVTGANNNDRAVRQAFDLGYTALDHDTRYGDRTVSWYRGPFVPFGSVLPRVVRLPAIDERGVPTGATPISSADEVLRYDPGNGMFDVSYAAAWQLGRLLALRDKTFALALFRWKRMNLHKTLAAVHEQGIHNRFGAALALIAPRERRLRSAQARSGGEGALQAPPAKKAAFQLIGSLAGLFDTLNAKRTPRADGPAEEVRS